jgi:hypothetical protein
MSDNEFIENLSEQETAQEPSKKTRTKKGSARSNPFISIINGEFLTKEFFLDNLSFIFYVIFMLVLLVAKGYYGKQLTKDVDQTQKELNEIMGDYVAKKARLEEDTRRIKLVEELAPIGLKETVNPTKVIRIKKK